MKAKDYQASTWRRTAIWFVALNKRRVISNFLRPLLFTGIPSLFVAAQRANALDSIDSSLSFLKPEHRQFITEWLADPLMTILAILLFVWGLKFIYSFIEDFAQTRDVTVDELIAINENINKVVDYKSRKVKGYLRSDSKESWHKIYDEQFFEDQIGMLCSGLKSIFELMYPRITFRLSLASVNGGKLQQWLYLDPDRIPRTTIDQLLSPNSAAMHAIKKKGIHIVSSIKKELATRNEEQRTFIKAGTTEADSSLLCFAISDSFTGEVIYLLSLSAKKPGTFQQNRSELYEDVIRQFTSRIGFEHISKRLRTRCHEG